MSTKLTITDHLKNMETIKKTLALYHIGDCSREPEEIPFALVTSRDELRAIDALIRFAEHVYPQADQINEVLNSFAIITRPLGEELNRPKKTDSRVRFFRALAAIRGWFFAEGEGLIQALRQ